MKKYLLPLILILCLTFTLVGYSADLYATYDQRIKLTVSNTNIDAELTWFPLTVFLTSTQGEEVFAEFDADADFDKVAFTTSDGSTQVYADCEVFDDSESKAIYHIAKTGVAISNTGTTDFYMYYDNDASANTDYISASGGTAAQSVWDANFKAVYHMADGASNAAIYDSTSNNNDGTKKATNTPVEIAAKVGQGQDYDGNTEHYITVNGLATTLASDTVGTISFWAKIGDEATAHHTIIGSANSAGGATTFLNFKYVKSTSDHMNIQFYQDGSPLWAFNTADDSLDSYYGNWLHVALVQNGTAPILYWNGTLRTDITWGSETDKTKWLKAILTDATTDADNMYLGALYYNGAIDANTFDGVQDEVIFSSTNRSAAWVKADYNSGSDTLLTYGAEETGGVTEANILFIFSNF